MGVAVHAPGGLLRHEVRRVEVRALTRDVRRIWRRVEERYLSDPALAVQGRVPEVLDPGADGRNRPGARYKGVAPADRVIFRFLRH